MQITADEYRLLRHKLLPKDIAISIDSIYRVCFITLGNDGEVLEKLKVRQVIKECIEKCDLTTLTDDEEATLIGLLLKCIKQ